MSSDFKELYEFSNFRLNVAERFLLRGEERLAVPDKVFETLCVLVRRGGELVTKDDLMEEVWGDTIVEENNLDKKISALRKILGERNGGEKFIETVRGHGFRFVAEVRRVNGIEGEKSEIGSDSESQISSLKFQTGNHNGDERPTASDELTTENQRLKTIDRIENPKSEIRNPKSNVVALAAWRHEAKDIASEKAETEKTTNIETQIASPASETIEPERVTSIESPHLAPTKSKSPKNGFALAAIVALVTLAGIGFGLYKFFNRPPIGFQAGKTNRITSTGKAKLAAVSPDGKYLAHVQEDGELQSLWVRQTATDGNVQIKPPAKTNYLSIEFSPDGNYVYYSLQDFSLNQISALGGASKQLFAGVNKSSAVKFSPNGKQIAFLRRSSENETSIIIAGADGSNERTLISNLTTVRASPFLVWSPDGKVILCPLLIKGKTNLLATQVADGNAFPILLETSNITKIAWLSDSKSFLMTGVDDKILQVSYPSGETRKVIEDLNTYTDISLSSDERFLFAVRIEQQAHIWTMPSNDASHLQQITVAFDNYDGLDALAWMPGGKIFYHSTPSRAKSSSWTIDTNGNNPKQLGGSGGTTAVSPDGRYLVYQNTRESRDGVGLFRFDITDGSEKRLTRGVGVWSAFSPDGKWIVFTRYADKVSLCKVSIEGGEPIELFDGRGIVPAVSPDGKLIAFIGDKDKKRGIMITPFDGGEPVKMFDITPQSIKGSKSSLQWTRDGRAINYLVLDNGVSNIWRQPIDGGAPSQVTNFTTDLIFNFAFSPDGSQLALSRGNINSDVVLIENAK